MAAISKLITENQVARISLFLGAVVVFGFSPKDNWLLMIENMAFLWVPQVTILYIFTPANSRSAVFSGAAIVTSLYSAAFGVWIYSRPHPDSLAWLGYLFSLPGAGIGVLIGALFIKRQRFEKAIFTGLVSALFTLLGLVANQALICNTLMFCGF